MDTVNAKEFDVKRMSLRISKAYMVFRAGYIGDWPTNHASMMLDDDGFGQWGQ